MDWMVQGSNPSGGVIFRTHPNWPWASLIHWYIWYGFFPRGKAAEVCVDHPSPLSIEVKERDEIYL
jgi:hypothetical protein